MKHKIALQFSVELFDIEPTIWRRIEVPSSYSFWDLHVAIQDSMGWLDCHLHEFTIKPRHERKRIAIGLHGDYAALDGLEVTPGWEVPISLYLDRPGDECLYLYDFGDDWRHRVVLEGMHIQKRGVKYPVCVGGERACPPEDCGGVSGYYRLLEILTDAEHEEYEEMVAWLSGHVTKYSPYDPARFECDVMTFDNPRKRLRLVLGD